MFKEAMSLVGFEDAFKQVLAENPPPDNAPWTYTIDKVSASVGGVVGTSYTVRVRITGQGTEL